MPRQTPQCQHKTIQLGPSACAARVGYEAGAASEILAAAELSDEKLSPDRGTEEDAAFQLSVFFPAPLILPGDELAYEPGEEGQSCRDWLDEEERNQPTSKRATIYVASVPRIDPSVRHIGSWTRLGAQGSQGVSDDQAVEAALAEDVIGYLGAFYHGMHLKPLPDQLTFTKWDGEEDAEDVSRGISYIGLAAKDNCTRVRARKSPDGIYPKQLNLEDILDAAIEMLPRDAYALLLLVDHDLYESDEDDFCCGRAYGGSRVCVVQTARYHPALDLRAEIDRAHMWPLSHCKAYLDKMCRAEGITVGRASRGAAAGPNSSNGREPMRLAIDAAMRAAMNQPTRDIATATAASAPPIQDRSEHNLRMQGLWLSRLARTTAHELGHCFGLDHCVYYACMMQSTASMAEDVRQPPYLCPVCLRKVTHAISVELQGGTAASVQRDDHKVVKSSTSGTKKKKNEAAQSSTGTYAPVRGGKEARTAYMVQRYTAIAEYCEKWTTVGMFAGYRAWTLARIAALREGS